MWQVIARIRNDYDGKFGVPRQSGLVDEVVSEIVFEPEFRKTEAIRGLDGFSHLWLIWCFDRVNRSEWRATVRPPRLGGNRRMGVFATRSPFRPNPIGLSCVRFLGAEKTEEGPVIRVAGADLVNGTPIYDIKPYLPYTDCHPEAVGGFAEEAPRRRLKVMLPEEAAKILTPEREKSLRAVLAEDPRPAYQEDPEREYAFEFSGKHIVFRVCGNELTVISVD